jgi:hypothetical protein
MAANPALTQRASHSRESGAHTAEAETDDEAGDQARHRTCDPNRRNHQRRTQLHVPGPVVVRNQGECRT